MRHTSRWILIALLLGFAHNIVAGPFEPTIENQKPSPTEAPEGMVLIPGGEFSMGCEDPTALPDGGPDPMRDARPIVRVYVDGFWMDRHEVTNDEFERFVKETGYITVAEQTPTAEEFPGAPPENLVAGSVVFTPPAENIPLDNHYTWWRYEHGANWRHPEGPHSSIEGRGNYPVVHIAYEDAQAYAKWANKRLPTEAEWEFASRGGVAGEVYAWGNELRPDGKWMANTWQGSFPVKDEAADGEAGIGPVMKFPVNRYGLYDMAGNVWEWVADWYRPDYYQLLASTGEISRNPCGPSVSFDPLEPGVPKRVQRGGSFLCNPEYCTRYMLGTRGKAEPRSSTSHGGFRCVRDF